MKITEINLRERGYVDIEPLEKRYEGRDCVYLRKDVGLGFIYAVIFPGELPQMRVRSLFIETRFGHTDNTSKYVKRLEKISEQKKELLKSSNNGFIGTGVKFLEQVINELMSYDR